MPDAFHRHGAALARAGAQAHLPSPAHTPLALPAASPHAGSELVQRTIAAMAAGGCEEVALEAEVTNGGALRLYQKLGFVRDKRLHRQAPPGCWAPHPGLRGRRDGI